MINDQIIPLETLHDVTLLNDILNINGETIKEVQWLKVDRIIGSLSIGDTVEFRVEVKENDDYVYKRGKGKIASIEKSGVSASRMRFSLKISVIRLVHKAANIPK